MSSTVLLAALKVLILAGGGQASENYNSHKVHVDRLLALLADKGVPAADVTVFWADGVDPGPDRAVVSEAPPADDWRIAGTRLDTDLALEPELKNTTFDGLPFAGPVRPAKRDALKAWLAEVGPTLGADDTLLVAVTDHGEADPRGGTDTSISLWGESWTVAQMAEDLQPVPTEARIVLWMSQCFSGGFADLHAQRPNLCGAFAAHPDRPSYGCYPELAARSDVGHFMRLAEALAATGDIARANDTVWLTDDTPDMPHLTSDVMLFSTIDALAARWGTDVSRVVDARLPGGEHPGWDALAALANRYGLGVVARYADAMAALDVVERARYDLGIWAEAWAEADLHARGLLAEPMVRVLRPARGAAARRTQRARAIAGVGRQLERDRPLAARIDGLRSRIDRADALAARIELQEAAAVRAAYMLSRMVADRVLDEAGRARYAALRQCESTPLWPDAEGERPQPVTAAPLAPLSALPAEVEALRPGWLGITYRDAPRNKGAVVERFEPGSPARATALAAGDKVVAIDGWTLRRRGGFREAALLARPGTTVPVTVKRGRSTEEIPVTVGGLPRPPPPPGLGQPVPPLGLEPLGKAPLPAIGEGRRTVLFFWQTTCQPCFAALRALAVWADAFDADVVAVTDEPKGTVRRALRRRPVPFPVALDAQGEAARLFAVERRPVFVLVDGAGRFADEGEGYVDRIPLGTVSQ